MSDQVEMISLRDVRVASLKGPVVLFKAKTPRLVPRLIVDECMAAGCAPTDQDTLPAAGDISRAKVEFVGDVRRSMLFLVVKLLAEENNVKNFDAGGYPKTAVVAERLGFEVNRKELVETYQRYQTSLQANENVELHPAAANVLQVLEADGKVELLALAEEFAPNDAAKLAGASVRDIRKTLLVRLSGVAQG